MTKGTGGGKSLFHSQVNSSSSKAVKAGTQLEQVPGGRSLCRDQAYWLVPPSLLSLLYYKTQDYQPKDDTTRNGLGPPTSTTNLKNMSYRVAYSRILWRLFVN